MLLWSIVDEATDWRPLFAAVLYLWKSTVWEGLILFRPAVGPSATCPHVNDGQACQRSNVEVSLFFFFFFDLVDFFCSLVVTVFELHVQNSKDQPTNYRKLTPKTIGVCSLKAQSQE